jgi:hypothetical protein
MNGLADRSVPAVTRTPLVLVICATTLLGDAVSAELKGIAEVRTLRAGAGDVAGLLRWTRPNAVVVDSSVEASAAIAHLRDNRCLIVHVQLAEHRISIRDDGGWLEIEDPDGSPYLLRNVLLASLLREGIEA